MTHHEVMVVVKPPEGSVQATETDGSEAAHPGADTLTLIRGRLPDLDQRVEAAFRENRSFRDLCRDYRTCFTALHRWKQLEDPEAARRRQEYTELLAELTSEIRTWLEGIDTRPPDCGDQ
jgi:hypothetical protein